MHMESYINIWCRNVQAPQITDQKIVENLSIFCYNQVFSVVGIFLCSYEFLSSEYFGTRSVVLTHLKH